MAKAEVLSRLYYDVDVLVALTWREVLKWVRRRAVLLVSISTPVFWIVLFGKSFNITSILSLPAEGIEPGLAEAIRRVLAARVVELFGTIDYFTYVATGMLVVFTLFQSMFGAVGVVFERRIGYLTRLLASPAPRSVIFLSKVLGTLFRVTVLSALLVAVAYLFGLEVKEGLTVSDVILAWLVLMVLGMGLSSLFTGIAFNVNHQEVLFALANLINLPLMFSSSALFPREQMPEWLQVVARVNPLTYAADLERYLIIGRPVEDPLAYWAYLLAVSITLTIIGYILSLRGMREV
ncbi:MAG: ABC transporter permease [Desulfurococcales archaeon]|nr:ABC transporter permease [Desulfurococcales archaeon]